MKDLLRDDRPVHVVRAEVEGGLGDAGRHHDPVRLDVGEIVEHETSDRHLSQILGGRGLGKMRQTGVLGMEGERDEGHEAARLVLGFAQEQHVVDALLQRLHMSVEHGRVRPEPKTMCGLGDVDPGRVIDL
jgi:hypothetical protein